MASATSSRPQRTDRAPTGLPDARTLEGPLRALAHERFVAPLLYIELTGAGANGRPDRRTSPAIEAALVAAVGTLLRRDDVVVAGPNARWYAALLLGRAVAASARSAVSDADLGIVAARLRASLRAAVDARIERSNGGDARPFGVRVGWTIIEPRDADRPLAELRHALRGAAVVGRIEERRGTVLAAITHELRTPLTSIVGFAERLLDEGDSGGKARRIRALGIIAEEARRLSRLVEGLIDAGAWQAGSLALRPRSVDLATIARRAKTLAAEAARERSVRVTVRGTAKASADPDRALQVLVNVIDNAIRHAKARGTVDVAIKSGRDSATVIVTDDGSGFDPQAAGNVGAPFAKGSKGKVGLGLAIASMLVAAHGGTIELGNRPGGGGCVTIKLPGRSTAPTHSRDGRRAGANRRLR